MRGGGGSACLARRRPAMASGAEEAQGRGRGGGGGGGGDDGVGCEGTRDSVEEKAVGDGAGRRRQGWRQGRQAAFCSRRASVTSTTTRRSKPSRAAAEQRGSSACPTSARRSTRSGQGQGGRGQGGLPASSASRRARCASASSGPKGAGQGTEAPGKLPSTAASGPRPRSSLPAVCFSRRRRDLGQQGHALVDRGGRLHAAGRRAVAAAERPGSFARVRGGRVPSRPCRASTRARRRRRARRDPERAGISARKGGGTFQLGGPRATIILREFVAEISWGGRERRFVLAPERKTKKMWWRWWPPLVSRTYWRH